MFAGATVTIYVCFKIINEDLINGYLTFITIFTLVIALSFVIPSVVENSLLLVWVFFVVFGTSVGNFVYIFTYLNDDEKGLNPICVNLLA
jgi:hypothetical protein